MGTQPLNRHLILASLVVVTVGLLIYIGPYPQDPKYHLFVDKLTLWGIANFFNVMSSLAFLGVGLWGVLKCRTEIVSEDYKCPYLIFAFGLILTTFGSGWYHLDPSNPSLVWDRLPMTISFMSLFSLILRDFVHGKTGKKILIPALLFGAASIWYWHVTDDLRPYIFVQFLPLLLIPFILYLYAPKYGSSVSLIFALCFYGAAKAAEYLDWQIYDALGTGFSGHTIKHLLAAASSYYALKVFLRSRTPSVVRTDPSS